VAAFPERPVDVTMNKDAGCGGHLFVTIRLEDGEELPVFVDTGSPVTVLDKSLEPKLGKCLGTETLWNFGAKYEGNRYAAPKLYLGNTRLITDSNALTSDIVGKVSARLGRPARGILGMDCLQHYCIQLDFKAGKMRFLDPNHLNTAKLGQTFAMTFSHAGQTHPEWFRLVIHQSSLVGGEDPNLLIDTGCSDDGFLKPEPFQREVREQRLRAPEDTAQSREPNTVELPRCVWNGATYTDLCLGNGKDSPEGKSGENALGLRFLARHLVTFDFPHRTLYLKQISQGPLANPEVIAAARKAGGSAYSFAKKTLKNGQLPGWSREDRGTVKRMMHVRFDPDTVTLEAVKKGDASTYHYEVTRSSKDSPWKLQKAWRTGQDDHLVEEYPVP
jgi:hypothetical protein